MDLNKNIQKSVKYLKKFCKKNKFDENNSNNFIYVFILYLQLKYKINVGLKVNNEKNDITLFGCLKSLYSNISREDAKEKLFTEKNEILYDIFYISDKKDTKNILKRLMSEVYSTDYVNLNVEILDYLGNTTANITYINLAYGLIWLKEINPDLKIPSKFINLLTQRLIEIARNNEDKPRYTNTEAVFILFMLYRILHFNNLDVWLSNFTEKQQNDGRWTNGYNSYFIDDIELYDSYHTVMATLVMLEYQVLEEYKNLNLNIEPPVETNITIESEQSLDLEENKEILNELPDMKNDNQIPNLIENFSMPEKENYFLNFEKVIPLNNKYSIHYNIYNVTFLVILIFLFFYAEKIRNPSLPV